MSSSYEINEKSFGEYAIETAKLLVKEYSWYYMPASVHKILLHGSLVISAALLLIGQMSEEAQEARNKDLKNVRENYSKNVLGLRQMKTCYMDYKYHLIHLFLASENYYPKQIHLSHKKYYNY